VSRCEHYDFDCEQEERTCEGCFYNEKGMTIKTKYKIGQRVWVVSENEIHKEVEVFSDTIEQIVIYSDGSIYYMLKELCEDVKEEHLIPYEDTELLLQKILDIDNRLNFKEES